MNGITKSNFFPHLFSLFNRALDSSLCVASTPLLSPGISISLVHVSPSLRNSEDGKTFLKIMIQLCNLTICQCHQQQV